VFEDLLDDGYDEFEAMEIMAAEGHPELREVLYEMIGHHDQRLRVFAALMLAQEFQDVKALPGLHEALQSWDRRMQKSAATAVWEIGDADTGGLIRALHFERGRVRDAIADALRLVGWFPDNPDAEVAYRIATRTWKELVMLGSQAVSGLVSALADPDGNVRRGAIWTLGQIGDARAVPFLIEMLDDPAGDMFGIGERVCDAAAEALERIGTEEALATVRAWRATQNEDGLEV
jgi:HEAT repeat protein